RHPRAGNRGRPAGAAVGAVLAARRAAAREDDRIRRGRAVGRDPAGAQRRGAVEGGGHTWLPAGDRGQGECAQGGQLQGHGGDRGRAPGGRAGAGVSLLPGDGARWPMARIVSVLLHPFAVFVALALAAGWRLDPPGLPRTAAGIAAAVAIVWAFVLHRRRSGRWQTVDASRPHERPALYLLALLVANGY